MGRYYSGAQAGTYQRCVLDVYGGNSCTWTVPTGTYTATFELWGGGGAGGPKCCCYCGWSTGGAGGGYAMKTVGVTPGNTYQISAGAGGQSVYCSPGGTNQGCPGGTSSVSGANLTNLCANGGGGGNWCSQQMGSCVCCGGASYGGDVCIYGGQIWWMGFQTWPCDQSTGGYSPLGGGEHYFHTNNCTQYFTCGYTGIFPGGGGTGLMANCCDCCGCPGSGAQGLVRITF